MKRLGWMVVLLAVGCGGGAPVSDNKRINELSPSERTELCEYWTDLLGPEREITCDNGDIETVGADDEDTAECAAALQIYGSPTCEITVGILDDCIAAQAEQTDAQACQGEPAACDRIDDFEADCFPTDDGGL